MDLIIDALSHTFNNKPARLALSNISLNIPGGEFVAIIGSSGCGKSTLLRLFANLLIPSEGVISIGGRSPAEVKADHQIAWMSQSPALLPWLTAYENVALAGKFHNKYSRVTLTAQEALIKVGLGDVSEAYPNTLSGGMQQRLALARTLMLDAGVWLMDEPFASLDELTRERLTKELLDIWQPLRPSVLWVTHNIYEAVQLSDRILVFSTSPGRLVKNITVNLSRPRRESSADFQKLIQIIRSTLEKAESTGKDARLT